jgi:hypothetical protein
MANPKYLAHRRPPPAAVTEPIVIIDVDLRRQYRRTHRYGQSANRHTPMMKSRPPLVNGWAHSGKLPGGIGSVNGFGGCSRRLGDGRFQASQPAGHGRRRQGNLGRDLGDAGTPVPAQVINNRAVGVVRHDGTVGGTCA